MGGVGISRVRAEEPQTIVFSYSGLATNFTVPNGVTRLLFDVRGAQGGHGGSATNTTGWGGKGGRVQGILQVTPGQVLHLRVGGQGQSRLTNAQGGWNGGGATRATSFPSQAPGGGGGGSDIRLGNTNLAARCIVAGGGGGSGGFSVSNGVNGGVGGGLTAGQGQGKAGSSIFGGLPGSQNSGGIGQVTNSGSTIFTAGSGQLGVGGDGVGANGGGGGGGGGYYGGAGAIICSGGGGSSFTDPASTEQVVHTQGFQEGNGLILLTIPSPPVHTGLPLLSGNARIGGLLSATPGLWSGYPDPEYTYLWQKAVSFVGPWTDAEGTGQGTASYTVVESDGGHYLRMRVVAVNLAGSAFAESEPSPMIPTSAPFNTSLPTVSGGLRVGEVVSVAPGSWSPAEPAPQFSYQWSVADSPTGPWNNATGVGRTSGSYTLAAADFGKYLRVTVSAWNESGIGSASSASVGPVVKIPQTITFHGPLAKTYGDISFAPGATASSGLAVSYSSSNTNVAVVSGGQILIVGAGEAILTASQAGNSVYEAAEPEVQTLQVSPKGLEIRADDVAMVYGGPEPDLTAFYTGFVPGDDPGDVPGVQLVRAAGTDAGTYVITVSGGTNANYSITRVNGTFTIEKASPTIAISPDPIPGKIFGNDPFQLTATHSAGLPVTWSSSATNVATVSTSGVVTITGTGSATITASHPGNSNYSAASLSRNLTVSSAQPSITFSPIPAKTYGDPVFFLSATSSAGLPLTYRSASTNVATVVASNGLVTLRGAGSSEMWASNTGTANYQPYGTNQTLTVNQALLAVTASNVSRPFGQTNPPLVFSIGGFKNGESTNVLTVQPAISTTATTNSPAGTYPITVSGGTASNYTFTYANATLTVTAAALASNSITLTPPASLVYDGSAKAYTASASGVSGFQISYVGRNGTSYAQTPTAPVNAGDYTVTATDTDPNYDGSRSAEFSISKATPTISAAPTASAITYGQALAASTLTGGTALRGTNMVAGSFAFTAPATLPPAGTAGQSVTFTPTDTANHNSVTTTVSVTVNQASSGLSWGGDQRDHLRDGAFFHPAQRDQHSGGNVHLQPDEWFDPEFRNESDRGHIHAG